MRRTASTGNLKRVIVTLAVMLAGTGTLAQHGHPLQGSWSGNWTAGNATGRLLVLLDFSADQVISGNIIEGSVRAPIREATLDPETWTVTLKADQPAQGGGSTPIEITGRIENLGSITERSIVGTWKKGPATGDVSLVIN